MGQYTGGKGGQGTLLGPEGEGGILGLWGEREMEIYLVVTQVGCKGNILGLGGAGTGKYTGARKGGRGQDSILGRGASC